MNIPNPFADDDEQDRDDQALVALARAGDRSALEALVGRHQAWIYNIAVRMLGHPQDAEDATQEILVKALTRLSSFEGRSRFRIWLYRIAVNHVLNMRRGRLEPVSLTFSCYAHSLDATPDLDFPDESAAGAVQGVVFTFLPLLANERGHTPAQIGLVFLVLGIANTVARLPAGWILDRSGRFGLYAFGGVAIAVAATVLIPHIQGFAALLVLAAVFGAVSGVAFVAISVELTGAAPAAARGLVMGGYSTALYLGLALGSLVLGPVITRGGHAVGFAIGGALGGLGALLAAILRFNRSETPRLRVARSAPKD